MAHLTRPRTATLLTLAATGGITAINFAVAAGSDQTTGGSPNSTLDGDSR